MKRTILLILMVVLTTISYSKSAKSWVQELDLVDISALNPKDVSSFWNAERNADTDYNTLLQAIQKNKKSALSAKANIKKFLYSSYSDRDCITVNDSTADAICDCIEKDLHIEGIRRAYPEIALGNLKFKIAANNEFNASTFPDGYILIYWCPLKLFASLLLCKNKLG